MPPAASAIYEHRREEQKTREKHSPEPKTKRLRSLPLQYINFLYCFEKKAATHRFSAPFLVVVPFSRSQKRLKQWPFVDSSLLLSPPPCFLLQHAPWTPYNLGSHNPSIRGMNLFPTVPNLPFDEKWSHQGELLHKDGGEG